MLESSIKRRIEYLIKHNFFIQKLYIYSFSLLFKIIGVFIKTNDTLVLFNSYGGLRFNDSPKFIYDAIINNIRLNHLQLVWAFQDPDKFSLQRGEKIKMDSLEYFITALRAKYWITNVNIERSLRFKKKSTKYLNTWHGIGTKALGLAYEGRKDYDFSYIDILTVQSCYEKRLFIQNFNAAKNSIYKCGLPRNDILFNANEIDINQKRKELNIPEDKTVILYAPTWRESIDKGFSYVNTPPITIKKWKERLGDSCVFLVRTHHRTETIQNVCFDDFAIDVSDYQEMNYLLMITDILITDYSASIFDFCILERPFICFAYDYEEYKLNHGLFMDFEKEMPYGICKDEDEVLGLIERQKKLDINSVIKFKKKYIEYGGNAVQMCIDKMFFYYE